MAVLEKISEVMQKNELVKKGIRKSMLMLMQEWKSFEEDSDLTTKCFQQCFNELEVREKHLSSVQESVVDSSQKLNLIRESVEQKRKEVEGKMEEVCAFRDREIRDLERKWKDFILAKQEFDETVKLREKKLNEQEKMGKRLLGKIKFEHKQLENKLELQELKSNLLKERLQLREGNRQLSEELDSMKNKLDLVNGELQQEKEKTQTEQGLFKKRMKEIALNELQVEVMEDRFKFKVLEETKKQLKTIGNAPEKTEAIDNVEVDRVYTTSIDSADIKLVLTMDGKALQIFLNEHEKKPDSMSDDVFRSLHLSRNPAMLVLDAMEGFYPPHLTMMKGDTEFEGTVVRKTCILVLEQLIRFSPKIQPTVRKRAMKLASEWKFKMTGDQLEILGFLYLLASYNLASDFDADELLNLLAVVAEHNKSSELCDLLGLTKKIPFFKKAIRIHSYISQRPLLLNLMRKFTKERNLVKPAKTRFATAFLTLRAMYIQRKNLRTLVLSTEWTSSKFAKETLGKDVANLIISAHFWDDVVRALTVCGPLTKVLRLVDGEKKPPMGYIYEAMDRAKETIERGFRGIKKQYEKVFEIIDARWSDQLHRPLHAAGHVLNPGLYYKAQEEGTLLQSLWTEYYACVEKMIPDTTIQDLLVAELPRYKMANGLFGCGQAKRARDTRSPGFVQNLIAKQKHLKAVKFAYAFVLADSFRPIPVLKDDLKQTIQISDSHCYADVCSVKEKNESIEQSVASIRAVIKCIMDHDLQSQYPPSQLEEYIESLTRQKTHVTTSIISEAQKPQQTQLKHMESTNPSVPADTKALSYTSSVGKASTCMLGHSDAMTSILVSMGGKNLQSFLNNHWKEQGLLRIEISSALKLSSDSGMLVLEALEGFYPPEPHSEEILLDLSVIRKSCILLLEQLMILSPKLKPEAKLEARKLAFDWKAKMKAETENHLAILGFLLLVGAYGLASAFNKDELESLCHTAAQDDNAYQICHVLSVAGERPQIERSIDPSKTEPLFNNVEMKGRGCDLISGCSLSFIHCVSDPAKLVLDALQKCRSANLGKYKYDPLVMKSFSDLLEHLRDVSPEITPQVKVEALVLSVEWHETLTGSQLNPSEVLRFLQLIATFELSSSYDSDELLGLLEIVYKSRRAINLFKILGLRDKVPCFIEKLIMRKQWLLAIRYIYVYKRVHLFPPVPLLKDYVLNAEELAKKIHDKGLGSREAKEKAINREISALRAAIKCILRHSLQSEYSPDLLRARIAKLQRQMADLRIPNQHSGNDRDVGILCAPISLAAAKKRLASATEGVTVHESQQQQRKLKRFCQLPTQTEVGQESIICNASLSSDVQSSSQRTSADAQSPNYSKDVFSQPSDDQICDSGQPSSQLIGSSHAYDDAKVETREPDLPVQASCHAADSGKLRSHSDHSMIDYSVPQSLSPQIDPFYHPGGNLMPNLQELLNKLMNSLPSSGKSEIGPSKKS